MLPRLLLIVLLAVFAQVFIVDQLNPQSPAEMSKPQGRRNAHEPQDIETEDPSTIKGKFMVGYQGWFGCPGDGEPVHEGHHGWIHWMDKPLQDGGRITFEMWPSTRELDPDELYTIPGLSLGSDPTDSRPAQVFSSRNPKTVRRHFRWMREHHIAGVFLQRFLSEVKNGDDDLRRLRDEVLQLVRTSAEAEGRVWAIMYDVSGIKGDDVERLLRDDILHLMSEIKVTNSASYLHESGKPVLAIWGMGMANDHHSPASLVRLLDWIQNIDPEGVYIFAGSPSHWRTRDGDSDPDPVFGEVWRRVQNISPWYVGRFADIAGADEFRQRMVEDMKFLREEDSVYGIRRDYTPVVFPGFSWRNLRAGPFNEIPRQGGTFLYRQLYNAIEENVSTVYGAMMDEMDEATALMPAEADKGNTPQQVAFLSLDADGLSLPDTWYMRICALAGIALAKGTHLPPRFPLEQLKGYKYTSMAGDSQGDLPAVRNLLGSTATPPPLPLHRPTQMRPPLPLPPKLPARAAPILPPRIHPRIIDDQRRLPPLPANGIRPPIREPPVRHNIVSEETAARTQANMEVKPNQATALLNKYITTPENRVQANDLYDKVNDVTQQTFTPERKEQLAKSVETIGAHGYKIFAKIRKGAGEA